MKKIYTTSLLVSMMMLTGCLEDQNPQQELPFNKALRSTTDLESVLVGAYDAFQNISFAGGNLTMISDLITEDTNWSGTSIALGEIAGLQINTTNTAALGLWRQGYLVINTANLILQALPAVNDSQIEKNRNRIKGESLFLRGVAYFEMARFFSKPWNSVPGNTNLAVPLLVDPVRGNLSEVTYPSRATLAAVYARAIADLQEAATLLPPRSSNGRANAYVANGYLMRVALQQGDFEKVRDYADLVIKGPYQLNATVETFFTNEFSAESIFEVSNTEQDTGPVNQSLTELYNFINRGGNISVGAGFNAAVAALIPPEQKAKLSGAVAIDKRISKLVLRSAPVTTLKYESSANRDDNAPVMRLAEIMLSYAEALAELNGVNNESVALLNTVRLRSFDVIDTTTNLPLEPAQFLAYQTSDFTTKEHLINAILLERQVELAFEGYRFHDLTRRGLPVKGLRVGSDKLVLPIPQAERDVNKNLEPNPGY
jgi:starch-binding outer membrane protein, SusD/RagB family